MAEWIAQISEAHTMTEQAARDDLHARGVWQIAPGLWCDLSVPDMIAVAPEMDTARDVLAALEQAGQLPPRSQLEAHVGEP